MESNRHLYSSGWGKVAWFIHRFGLKEVFRKPLRTALAPWILRFTPAGQFRFGEVVLPYFYHRYNCTWANERCVEIPVARHYLEQCDPKEVLEVGNVMSHYLPIFHDVVDKYEQGRGVINEDILDFKPDCRYRLIISISTFEHIGYDDAVGDGSRNKIPQALASCKALLAAGGRLILTVPVGYNPELDEMIADGSLGAGKQWFLRRMTRRTWVPCDWPALAGCRYGQPYPYANGIMVGEF